MSQLRKAPASRSRGSSVNTSMHTAWKMSAASSGPAPYFSGIEKIRFLYFAINADQARSSPFKQALMRRSSFHVASGPPSRRPGAVGWGSSTDTALTEQPAEVAHGGSARHPAGRSGTPGARDEGMPWH